MYYEAYKVYQGVLNNLPKETDNQSKKQSGGLLGRPERREEPRARQPIDRIARYVASIRRDRRELNNG